MAVGVHGSSGRCSRWRAWGRRLLPPSQTARPRLPGSLQHIWLLRRGWRSDGVAGWAELAGFFFALACCGIGIALGQIADGNPNGTIDGYPPAICYVFASLAGLAAALDLNVLMRRKIGPAQRIARHLWRMCVAFFLAAASLFLGQQDDVFWFMEGSPLLFIPPFVIMAVMLFWIIRMRRGPLNRQQQV